MLQQQAEYNWIKQGWEAGQVNQYQLWDLANGRLDFQHHMRLFLELGFIPLSGFPLVPVRIQEWVFVHDAALYGRWNGYLAIVRPLSPGNVFLEVFSPAGNSLLQDTCTLVEVAQWRVEAFLRDKVVENGN
jgi:hypothetical protein